MMTDVAYGQDVLRQEAAALLRVADVLDGSFEQAVALLAGCEGRVVVSGMGKSGHVGAKIAATFASTGTPAFFVHPAEASHGDLGMITPSDVVLALSHSGETKELGDVLAHCARFGVPLIALTGRENSALGRAATVVLLNGVEKEACPNNLAPTTSTTVMLALGDALAVALMHRRGFKPEDFAVFHPGGKLGSRLVRVDELMHKGDDVPLVAVDASMDKVIFEMTAKRLGLVGVCSADGRLTGVVTDGDLRRHFSPDLLSKTAADVMTKMPKTIASDVLAAAGVKRMQDMKITALFVLDGAGLPVGVLHIHDCLKAGIV